MTDLLDLAVSWFEAVGGPDWRADLALGGVSAIAALVLIVLIVTAGLLRAKRKGGSDG